MQNQPVFIEIAKQIAKNKSLTIVGFAGKGSFKETYHTRNNGNNIALKVWDPKKCNPARSEREIEALRKCDTTLIGKLYEFDKISLPTGSFYFSLEEFLDGGTLTNQLAGSILPPETVRHYAIHLINAVSYLKNINLVHRDIKPDNIMFRNNFSEPVLVDLGIARDLSVTSLTASWQPQGPCTPYYAAPEQLNNEKHLIDWRTDQFSLGIVLGICLTGKHPFAEDGMNEVAIVDAVANRKKCTLQFCKNITSLGFDAIIQMIAPWPILRYQSIDKLSVCFNEKTR